MSEIVTFNYYCLNDGCSNNDMVKVTKPRSKENKAEKCPDCGKKMKIVGESPSGGYGTFAGMNAQQRGEMLDKRASKHFKKMGQEMKREKLRIFDNVK